MVQQEYGKRPEYTYNLPRLSEWDNTYIVIFTLESIGIIIRLWSFKVLDEFFTFDIMIKKNHKLIKHGPYRYLIHPSYTGMLFHWPFVVYFAFQFAQFVKFYKLSFSPITYSILSFLISSCLPSSIIFKILVLFTILTILNRMRNEEAMLKNHFGKEWDEYVKTRWRLIPYLI
ncbi:hypothetical protein Glove_184g143 [Diversispora epigaea]|uniref:Protein-S-isoprenylcysteine O-methyltransferase n=1 Tax=Diversispora epigaea TaxID=1348612 RepID=A0A397IVQ5_9GLOM|nr:hypothetical protein Glove_184g143 [Diversispora epigaea]